MAKKRRKNKKSIDSNIWTEEEYDEYMADLYGLEYIAGYTESGVPYGIVKEEKQVSEPIVVLSQYLCYNQPKINF